MMKKFCTDHKIANASDLQHLNRNGIFKILASADDPMRTLKQLQRFSLKKEIKKAKPKKQKSACPDDG